MLPCRHFSFGLECHWSAWPGNEPLCQSNTETFRTLYEFIINHYSFLSTACKWREGQPIALLCSSAAEGGWHCPFSLLLYKAELLPSGTTCSVVYRSGFLLMKQLLPFLTKDDIRKMSEEPGDGGGLQWCLINWGSAIQKAAMAQGLKQKPLCIYLLHSVKFWQVSRCEEGDLNTNM